MIQKTYFSKISTFLVLLFSVSNVFSWGSHYIVTDRTLEHASMGFTNEKVKVETLDSFVKAEKEKIYEVFKKYYQWLSERDSERFNKAYLKKPFDIENPGRLSFLKAARLNPLTKFPLVNRIIPGQKPIYDEVSYKDVSPYLHQVSPFLLQFEDVEGKEVTIKSVLSTFADEPDWQFDHTLFQYKEYGYQEQPYGKPKGESSKAPFHLQFDNENFVVRWFASSITQGMVLERVKLFSELAKVALETKHGYWGYRFSAWAIHYIQDLAQPYHSKAVPHAGFCYYLNFMFSFGIFSDSKSEIKRKTTQLVANRHFAYEDFVSYGLEMFYVQPTPLFTRLVNFLKKGDAYYKDVKNEADLMEMLMEEASDHSETMDEIIVEAFGSKITEDPEYDFENDKSFSIAKFISDIKKEERENLLKETGEDFERAGRAARTLIKLIRQDAKGNSQ